MEKQEKQGHIGELIESTLNNIRSFAQTNTIIGTPIQAEGVTLIPVSRMSVGYGGGGMELSTKDGKVADGSYGGGTGAGARLDPVAVLVIRGDSVKLLPVAPPPANTIDRVIETVPEVVDKVTGFIEKQQEKKAAAAAEKLEEADLAE